MSLFKFINTFLLLVAFSISHGQNKIKGYVQANIREVKSIESAETDFTDLEIIGKAIGEARVVMLGEQDHGDAPVYLAKTRLIKYLHEVKGFDVLVFESDFFGLTYGWERLDKQKSKMDSFLRENIAPIWTYCDECKELLYNYIPATYNSAKPIQVAGMDNEMVLDYTSKHLTKSLDSVLRYLRLPITTTSEYFSIILPTVDSLRQAFLSKPNDGFFDRLNQYFEVIKQHVAEKLEKDSFWLQLLDNLASASKTYELREKDLIACFSTRDNQMAQNLKWLLTVKYPKEKILVWAANAHIARYTDTSSYGGERLPTTMGNYFTKDSTIARQTYVLGFTSNRGRAGRLTDTIFNIPPAEADSFEGWMDSAVKYAFVDFSSFKDSSMASEKFLMKGAGHYTFKEHWTKLFDGIFYIRDMYPCSR